MPQEMKRPDPDALLKIAERQERGRRGRLKVYFGAAPGVGKTYAMLNEAFTFMAEGGDVLVGLVETHGRGETEALLAGLKVLPRKKVDHRGIALEEFDLDEALRRQPSLILVDELAHTNAPGSRHDKRWQDVEELLDAGIDVHTTVNVQHVESLNDVVAKITGVRVRETIPDALLEKADDIVLVDLPPDDLLKRLAEGKVYLPRQADLAVDRYFRSANLVALRELALRFMAERVNVQVLVHRQGCATDETWATSERLLVCVGPSPSSANVIRAAKRLAGGLQAPWWAVWVQTGQAISPDDAARAHAHLKMAEQLGAEPVILAGADFAKEVTSYAKTRNVTRIVIGKPGWSRWKSLLSGSPVDELIRRSGDIDVQVVTGIEGEKPLKPADRGRKASRWRDALASALVVAGCTGLGFLLHGRVDEANIVMFYLLGVVVCAFLLGRTSATLASVFGVLAFDFFFVPPHLTFAVSDMQYLIVFGVMLATGLVIAQLTSQVSRQAQVARRLQQESMALADFSQKIATARGLANLCDIARTGFLENCRAQVSILSPDAAGRLAPCGTDSTPFNAKALGVATWAFENRKEAGHGADALGSSDYFFLPLSGSQETLGVLALQPSTDSSWEKLGSAKSERLFSAMLRQIALAMEVERLEVGRRETIMAMETERVRASILSIATHDFQTPLATIRGAAESLKAIDLARQADVAEELIDAIVQQSQRLSRLVSDLLKIVKLTTSGQTLAREPWPVGELVSAALGVLEQQLAMRTIRVIVPVGLPAVRVDPVLMEQLLVNLVENALKHSPVDSEITVAARSDGVRVELEVSDNGPGIPAGELTSVFDMFYKGRRGSQSGNGLGLAICRAVALAHGGEIAVENKPEGGARFLVTLPAI